MPNEPHFARRLVRLREAAGISQYELARRAGLTRQALSLLEMGEREPNWITVQRLAAALEVPCDSFVDPGMTVPGKPAEPSRGRGRPRKQPADGGEQVKKPKGPGKGKRP